MSEKSPLLNICTVLEAVEKIKIYAQGFATGMELREANDQMNFNAICRLLLTIGEETRKIPSQLIQLEPQINWSAIIGLRNRMAHDYRGIDADIVFDILAEELPILKLALINLLPQFSIGKDELGVVLTSEYFKHIFYISDHLKVV
jgi:uncharacterized protein with HEPN domain